MNNELKQKLEFAEKNKTDILKVANKLKKSKPKSLDDTTHRAHDLAFKKIDCLDCANCCKTTSPTFYERDIDRIAKHLKVRPSQVIEKYLHKDEVGDYVLNVAPCPFLDYENYCTIYESRPTACREYPHTNRKRFYQILDISVKNTEICPAVADVFEQLKKVYS
ncbi:MAG: YkgJ family cysteine cluster protein [Flavobacteriales bacterium]|nr:YkgJ family cysteine cluster protein [Flavobacteriales bacterium]MCB9173536.1 YkgJ family cysteine cluster protein [Flavobacteriales bacterium]